LAILDFHSPFPYKNPFKHNGALFSYKMDYSKMFLWNPEYRLLYRHLMDHSFKQFDIMNPDNCIAVNILMKSSKAAFVNNPFDAF
jgi:hypothetical protein